MLYALHGNTHAARAAGNGPHGGGHIGRRQVRHLGCCDFFRLLAGQLAHLIGVRRLAALLNAGGLLDQDGCGRSLHDEGEALVRERGNHYRDRQTGLNTLGLRIERLAEFHDIQAALTQCRADRRAWICLASRHLQLDIADYFLCHYTLLSNGYQRNVSSLPNVRNSKRETASAMFAGCVPPPLFSLFSLFLLGRNPAPRVSNDQKWSPPRVFYSCRN